MRPQCGLRNSTRVPDPHLPTLFGVRVEVFIQQAGPMRLHPLFQRPCGSQDADVVQMACVQRRQEVLQVRAVLLANGAKGNLRQKGA